MVEARYPPRSALSPVVGLLLSDTGGNLSSSGVVFVMQRGFLIAQFSRELKFWTYVCTTFKNAGIAAEERMVECRQGQVKRQKQALLVDGRWSLAEFDIVRV